MENNEGSDSPSWRASLFMPTAGDVARAVVAAATAATASSSPSSPVVNDDSGGHLQKLQQQVSRLLRGLSDPPEVKSRAYNPEVLTKLKRQWASFQMRSLDHRIWKEPSRIIEGMVVVGLHPNCDIRPLQNLSFGRKSEGSSRFRTELELQSLVETNLEPQVLYVYPPQKQLPLTDKDLISFCLPAGVEVHAVERTSSMSELNEILLGQEHFRQSDLSFIFRMQVADLSTLYGCCVLVDEIIQESSGLLFAVSDRQQQRLPLSRHILTTRRCYCILTRVPCFELHFGVFNSMFTEERLERLTKNIGESDMDSLLLYDGEENFDDNQESLAEISATTSPEDGEEAMLNGTVETSQSCTSDVISEKVTDDDFHPEHQNLKEEYSSSEKVVDNKFVVPVEDLEAEKLQAEKDFPQISEACDTSSANISTNNSTSQMYLPLSQHQLYESFESSSSFQGSPSEDRNYRNISDETELEEASVSGQSSDHNDILEWAKANNHGSLQIISEYYQLSCPARGSTLKFHPLEHLHPLEFHRPDEAVLCIAGSTVDPESCGTGLEKAEVRSALMAEEEATALSVWAVACLCGSLRLEHVLTLFAGVLLEKKIVILCSNLGILSASILSIIPLIRPFKWQSLLMPVLPKDMQDFLDAPVPYIVGVKTQTDALQSKLADVILIDANKNQVRSPTIPELPRQKELYSSLAQYHSKLVGESYLGRKRPVYQCTDIQVAAANNFLAVVRSYLDSLTSNLRSHTITNVQSNDDKVSLLLKESFIESFPNRDRPFMKLFLDTQLFTAHTDLMLSFFQKE
ncbi:UDENN domain-containing protein [Heracleum sosnowskyi]|uniref:UDENN domain-containing protein n=1 Tax=Heracleum sosnowskyi TaxID=360622 RepID=A0AAD8MLK2_9APIA|nr:UDENN domain-containing protein [Heracleum sosnowskyi]